MLKMTKPSIYSRASGRIQQLMAVLLADATAEVKLVSREVGLTEVVSERLRRVLDRLECVAAVLETIRSASGGYESAEVLDATRYAVGELAAQWPRDYSTGAVEWVMLAD